MPFGMRVSKRLVGFRSLSRFVLLPPYLAIPLTGTQPTTAQQLVILQPGAPVIQKDLRTAPGKLIAEGNNKTPTGPRQLLTYTLEEVPLSKSIELELRGKRESLEKVFRLTITGGESLAAAGMIWIDDAALMGIWSHGAQKIGALISDRSILRDGAEISISNRDGSQLYRTAQAAREPQSYNQTTSRRWK